MKFGNLVEIWSKFGPNLPLATFGSERVNCYSGILYSSAMRGFKITSTPMKANTENVIQFDLLTPLEN